MADDHLKWRESIVISEEVLSGDLYEMEKSDMIYRSVTRRV